MPRIQGRAEDHNEKANLVVRIFKIAPCRILLINPIEGETTELIRNQTHIRSATIYVNSQALILASSSRWKDRISTF